MFLSIGLGLTRQVMYAILVNIFKAANPGAFPNNMEMGLFETPDQLQDGFRNFFARSIGGGIRPSVEAQRIIVSRLGLRPWIEPLVVHLSRGQYETLKGLVHVTDEQVGMNLFADYAALQAAGFPINGVRTPMSTNPSL